MVTGVRGVLRGGEGEWGVRQVSFISRNWIRRFAELWSYAKLNYDDVTDGLTAGARLRAHHKLGGNSVFNSQYRNVCLKTTCAK